MSTMQTRSQGRRSTSAPSPQITNTRITHITRPTPPTYRVTKVVHPHPGRSSRVKEQLQTIKLLNTKITTLTAENNALAQSWALNLETDGDWLAGLLQDAQAGGSGARFLTDAQVAEISEVHRQVFVKMGDRYRASSEYMGFRKLEKMLVRQKEEYGSALEEAERQLGEARDQNKGLKREYGVVLSEMGVEREGLKAEVERLNRENAAKAQKEKERYDESIGDLQAQLQLQRETSLYLERELLLKKLEMAG